MSFLEYVGATAVGLIGLAITILLLEIAGNIYGGIKGAYRLRAIKTRGTDRHIAHWPTIKLGLRSWHGVRYQDGYGTYWRIGGMIVPVDGRDPIERERYPG